MWLQPTSFLDSANYSLLALSAGNFVIGKATPTATLAVSNSPQTYTGSGQAATVTISASSVPGAVPIFLPEQQLKLMREPMRLLRSYGLSYTTAFLLFQQGFCDW
jgi:hypothetical protein